MSLLTIAEYFSEYDKFAFHVMWRSRYVRDSHCQGFLDTLIQTAEQRRRLMSPDTRLWRAVLAHRSAPFVDDEGREYPHDVVIPAEPKRMVPWTDHAYEGRVNPKGIPCLYCATQKDTAMKEVRPWVGSFVSVGQFRVTRALQVVDCSVDTPGYDREACFWMRVNRAFAEPVRRGDDVAEYSPTQVIAETFREAGFDGIAYRSCLGDGANLAIFDLDAAELVECHVCQVEALEMKFRPAGASYRADEWDEHPNATWPVTGPPTQEPDESSHHGVGGRSLSLFC